MGGPTASVRNTTTPTNNEFITGQPAARRAAHSRPVLACVGTFTRHRLSPANKPRLSLCHGDSRVFTTAGRVSSSLSAATIAVRCLPPPTNLRVGIGAGAARLELVSEASQRSKRADLRG